MAVFRKLYVMQYTTSEIDVCLYFRSVLFVFQAEAGIRDHCVTGVQTCALPISSRRRHTRSLCDWSSDVCSSDLQRSRFCFYCHARDWFEFGDPRGVLSILLALAVGSAGMTDRKSGGEGKSVGLGGRRIIKKKKKKRRGRRGGRIQWWRVL